MLRKFLKAALAASPLLAGGAALAAPQIDSAVLPNARSVEIGTLTTVFAVISNSGDETALNCRISLAPTNAAPVAFGYQTIDGALNPVGTPDTPVDILAGISQFFVVEITPTAAWNGPVVLAYVCDNAVALGQPDVNDVHLFAEAGPDVPDLLSVSLTPSGDGVIRIAAAGGTQVMTIAATWIDSTPPSLDRPAANPAFIRVTPELPGFNRLIDLEICETDLASICLGARDDHVDTVFSPGTVRTFAIFATADAEGGVPLLPDMLRVRAEFADREPDMMSGLDAPQAVGDIRSATSQAVSAPAPAGADSMTGFYEFRIRDLINDPRGLFQDDGDLVVAPDGMAMGSFTVIETGTPFTQVFRLDGEFDPEGPSGPVFGGELTLLETPDGEPGLTGSVRLRVNPRVSIFGRFDGTGSAGDAPAFFRESELLLRGPFIPGKLTFDPTSIRAEGLQGLYNLSIGRGAPDIGTMQFTDGEVTGSVAFGGGPACSILGAYNTYVQVLALVRLAVIVSGCGDLNGDYEGLGYFHRSRSTLSANLYFSGIGGEYGFYLRGALDER